MQIFKNKKAIIVVVVLLIAVLGIFFLVRGRGESADDESNLRQLSLSERPFTTLAPKEDGRWLKLKIENINVSEAKSIEYLLEYKVPDGATQGVPGTVLLDGKSSIERDLLLGSESAGKFRYDEGVTQGTISLKFRNDKGKTIAKLSTDFHLQKDAVNLNAVDGKFVYKLKEEPEKVYFVTMSTFGLPKTIDGVKSGPYGVFPSKTGPYPGKVEIADELKMFNGSEWKSENKENVPDVGIFVGVGQ